MGISQSILFKENTGVADGARTHDNRNHNPGLYQLSYSHRRKEYYFNLRMLVTEEFLKKRFNLLNISSVKY